MTLKAVQGCVVFLDSGAGGLPYLNAYRRLNPDRVILYIADKKNFPYGEKTKEELVTILIQLTARIKKFFSPSLIVLACNTASVSALMELRENFPDMDFVGTVPAVKPAMLYSAKKNIAVIGTERTLADDYITRLAEETAGGCTITRIAAGELVEFVEKRMEYSEKAERIMLVKKYTDKARNSGADALALGCTHFLFLLDEFKEASEPDIRVFDSVGGVCGRIENILAKKAPTDSTHRPGEPQLLLVTGGRRGGSRDSGTMMRGRCGGGTPAGGGVPATKCGAGGGLPPSNHGLIDDDEQWALRAARFNLEFFDLPGWDY